MIRTLGLLTSLVLAGSVAVFAQSHPQTHPQVPPHDTSEHPPANLKAANAIEPDSLTGTMTCNRDAMTFALHKAK
jgi:hypothetical protein